MAIGREAGSILDEKSAQQDQYYKDNLHRPGSKFSGFGAAKSLDDLYEAKLEAKIGGPTTLTPCFSLTAASL